MCNPSHWINTNSFKIQMEISLYITTVCESVISQPNQLTTEPIQSTSWFRTKDDEWVNWMNDFIPSVISLTAYIFTHVKCMTIIDNENKYSKSKLVFANQTPNSVRLFLHGKIHVKLLFLIFFSFFAKMSNSFTSYILNRSSKIKLVQ